MADGFTHNDSIIVENIGGTSSERYRIDSLYSKYLAAGGRPVETCQRKGCSNDASVTAHARMTDGRRSKDWFLTRLCARCNHHTNGSEMALRKNAKLIAVRDVTGT